MIVVTEIPVNVSFEHGWGEHRVDVRNVGKMGAFPCIGVEAPEKVLSELREVCWNVGSAVEYGKVGVGIPGENASGRIGFPDFHQNFCQGIRESFESLVGWGYWDGDSKFKLMVQGQTAIGSWGC